MATGAPTRTSTDIRPMPTPTDARVLTLAQWLSPAFPVGAFAYSHGVETAIRAGWITDGDGLAAWLRDCLTEGSGRSDAIFLRLAFAAADPGEVDALARSFATGRERLREAERQGAAFVRTVNAVWDLSLPDLLLSVAVGRAAGLAGLDPDLTVSLYLHAFVTNLVSAAIRLSPLGQTEGQRIIRDLQPLCTDLAADTRDATATDIVGHAFLSDIAAMRHETLEPRLFQS